MVRRLRKRKSCWRVIAIPQASIAAPTLTVMQDFEEKKRLLRAYLSLIPYTPYSSIPRNRNPSANRTPVRWLEAEHNNTTLASLEQCHDKTSYLNQM